MKRHFILLLGLSLLMIVVSGCYGIGGPSECSGVGGTFTSTIKISIRDKQTGQPIPNAKIHISRTEVFHWQAAHNCDKLPEIVEEINSETDISGLFSFSYTYTTKYWNDFTSLSINVTADQYSPLETYVQPKPGVNDINLRILNISNQP